MLVVYYMAYWYGSVCGFLCFALSYVDFIHDFSFGNSQCYYSSPSVGLGTRAIPRQSWKLVYNGGVDQLKTVDIYLVRNQAKFTNGLGLSCHSWTIVWKLQPQSFGWGLCAHFTYFPVILSVLPIVAVPRYGHYLSMNKCRFFRISRSHHPSLCLYLLKWVKIKRDFK